MSRMTTDSSELLNLIQSGNIEERRDAVTQLANAPGDDAIAGLVLALEDSDAGIREMAAEALMHAELEISTALLSQFLSSDNITTRNLAAEILVKIGSGAVPALISFLHDPDHDVRKFVVDTVGMIGDRRATKSVCEALGDTNLNVSCSAAEALGNIGDPAACEELLRAMGTVEEMAPQAIEALGKIGDDRAVNALISKLACGDSLQIYAASEALGKIGSPAALRAMASVLKSDSIELAEEAFKSALRISQIIQADLHDHIPIQRIQSFISAGFAKNDSDIVDFAGRNLCLWRDGSALSPIVRRATYLNERSRGALTRQLQNLGVSVEDLLIQELYVADSATKLAIMDIASGAPQALSSVGLRRFASDADPEVRSKVAFLLGKLTDGSGVETLGILAEDAVGHVRAAAFRSLGWLHCEGAVAMLIAGIDDQYVDVREACVGALISIGGEAVIEYFSRNLKLGTTEQQRLSAKALGWIGEDSVVEPLTTAVNHSAPQVRKQAIEALCRIGRIHEMDALLPAINDEDEGVQRSAITGVARFVPHRAVRILEQFIDDDNIWMRTHVIAILGELDDLRAVGLLIKQLTATQDVIRIAAINALAANGSITARAALQSFNPAGNNDLSVALSAALARLSGEGVYA